MQAQTIMLDRDEARKLYLKYRTHQHYQKPVDQEIAKTYRLISQGRVVIKALASVVEAGLGADGLPKLAIVRADATNCWLELHQTGYAQFASKQWIRSTETRCRIEFPAGSFKGVPRMRSAKAIVPLIPVDIRPKRGLENYHVLWEADWQDVPVDPMLIRRIGKADLWMVLGAWDLTEVERAVLSGRLNG
jgi:hypothetical protein